MAVITSKAENQEAPVWVRGTKSSRRGGQPQEAPWRTTLQATPVPTSGCSTNAQCCGNIFTTLSLVMSDTAMLKHCHNVGDEDYITKL